MRSRRKTFRHRRGAAAVELAITLPLMMTIVFGSIEICQLIHSRHSVESAAYACALVAVSADGTDADVQTRMTEILSQRGVNNGTVVTTPVSIEGLERGTQVTVLVSAPFIDNTWLPVKFVSQPNIQSQCVMLKEI